MIIRTLLFIASGNVKWYKYLENSLGVLYKVEHTFTPKYYLSHMKACCSQEVLYTNVHNSFIHKGQ